MDSTIKYLLVGNSRLHWAEKVNDSYQFNHIEKNQFMPKNLDYEKIIWASVGNHSSLPLVKKMKITTERLNFKNTPSHIGIDRALGCFAAYNLFKNKSKKNLVIADFGTILSITKMDHKGNIIGGQLIPGLLTQLKSMTQNAKNLIFPNDVIFPNSDFPIATNEAMIRGVYSSLIGTVNLLVNKAKDILIICGGDANAVSTHLSQFKNNMIIEPNLVMRGMILFNTHKTT